MSGLEVEEWEREWVEESFRAYLFGTRGCSEAWVAGIIRAASPSVVKIVFKEAGTQLRALGPERFANLERLTGQEL